MILRRAGSNKSDFFLKIFTDGIAELYDHVTSYISFNVFVSPVDERLDLILAC